MSATKSANSKLIAGSLGLLCFSIVIGMGFYLPFYSKAAKDGEEARRKLHLAGKDHAPGGMWKNINAGVTHSNASTKKEENKE